MEREACPQKVIDRASILYHNGLTGFQGPHGGGKDLFVLCFLNSSWDEVALFEKTTLPSIKEECSTASLELGDWIGRDYLSIHWSEIGKRFLVLNALLKHAIPFQTATKTMPCFSGKGVDVGITEFTPELFEDRIIEQMRTFSGDRRLIGLISEACYYDWNWTTPRGKAFALELRRNYAADYRSKYDSKTTNFYEWDIFTQPHDPLTLCDIAIQVVEDDKEVCMICMENEANTMVLPCEHCVVCRECSARLESTNNSWLCIKCRQIITHKLS